MKKILLALGVNTELNKKLKAVPQQALTKQSAFWLSYTSFVHVFWVYFPLFCSSVQEEMNFMFFPKVNGHINFRVQGEQLTASSTLL